MYQGLHTTGVNNRAVSDMISAHARYLRARGTSPATVRDRTKLLSRLHRDLPYGLAFASTDEIEAWLAMGRDDLDWSQWTQCTYYSHACGFYRWAAVRLGWADPTADLERPRTPDSVPRPVTDDELALALELVPEPWTLAVKLAAFGGLRAAEIAGLKREHVTQDTIWIERAKGGNPASVDTHPIIWEAVEPLPPGPVCVRTNGRPVTAIWLSARAKATFTAIGLPDVRLHRFRHWFGTALLDAGANTREAQMALRHKRLSSTEVYTLVRAEQRRLAIRSLPRPTQHPDEHRS